MASCNLKITSEDFFGTFQRMQNFVNEINNRSNIIPIWRISKKSCQKLKSIISYIEILL